MNNELTTKTFAALTISDISTLAQGDLDDAHLAARLALRLVLTVRGESNFNVLDDVARAQLATLVEITDAELTRIQL
jgi:hypothetical protein